MERLIPLICNFPTRGKRASEISISGQPRREKERPAKDGFGCRVGSFSFSFFFGFYLYPSAVYYRGNTGLVWKYTHNRGFSGFLAAVGRFGRGGFGGGEGQLEEPNRNVWPKGFTGSLIEGPLLASALITFFDSRGRETRGHRSIFANWRAVSIASPIPISLQQAERGG